MTRRAGIAPTLTALSVTLALAAAPGCSGPDARDESARAAARTHIRAVDFGDVTITDDFWRPRMETNRRVTIPHILRENVETGRVANFEKAAGRAEGEYEGRRFNDTDVYKVIEAASYAIAQHPDPELEAQLDELIELVAAAQQEDGYLYPARTIDPDDPAPGVGTERWIHVSAGSHELYNAGHLIEAAVAHHRATGKRTLLEVAIHFADLIDRDFGPDARRDVPGHEEIELALVKLADVTGEERYTELARFFIDQRGAEHSGAGYAEDTDFAIYNDRPYKQDHLPVIEQTKASGHAVRATYLYTGMADVAARTDAPGYREALDSIWDDVVSTKLYLTGGIGSRGTFESFGEDYELPNQTAYTETCAAVGNDLWNHRMFLDSGDPAYLDVMERVLYNGYLSGVSAEGDSFFYTNPLESNGRAQRSEYFDVACCPANLARLMALLPGFVYANTDDTIYVNLFVGSEATVRLRDGVVRVRQETGYPWDGAVRIVLEPEEPIEFTLNVRLPGWAFERPVPSDLYTFAGAAAAPPRFGERPERMMELDWAPGSHFGRVTKRWEAGDEIFVELPMPVRRVVSHPSVTGNQGKVALQRGPLVYAIEGIDNGGGALDLALPDDAELTTSFEPDLLGGLTVVRGAALRESDGGTAAAELTAIPYFAWANRGRGEMAVWLPRAEGER